MLAYEHTFWDKDPSAVLAGVDEVGRGPLAGPVYASAVVIASADADSFLEGPLAGLTDSKKLTEAKREHFHGLLHALPGVRIGIGSASVAEIDSLNILRATHLAMRRAVLDLGDPPPDHVLVDGLPVRGLPCPSTAIVKGDAQSLLIAAASVVAKVTRDHLMAELDAQYPGYGFAANKGYGTAEHLEALRRLGVSPVHRRSFAPVADILAPRLDL
ncbi:MAG: ribonuclease HII [Kiritimatiellae bacterium]|nr:ribonuclease HII [Kiritimatiellia bacterium]